MSNNLVNECPGGACATGGNSNEEEASYPSAQSPISKSRNLFVVRRYHKRGHIDVWVIASVPEGAINAARIFGGKSACIDARVMRIFTLDRDEEMGIICF